MACIGLHGSLYGEEAPDRLLQEATQIVIGPGLGEPFDPATEAVARIRDKEIIQKILQSTTGKEPENIDHYLLLPNIQVAVLDAKGEIIAAYALDRTPAANKGKVRAVLRKAEIIMKDGKARIESNPMNLLEGFPCEALEAYRFEDEESPKTKSEQDGTEQPATQSRQVKD